MDAQTSDGYLNVKEGTVYWKYDVGEDADSEESRSILLLIHAGVADHTLWDEQVQYLVQRGWNCLRFDLFGYGRSQGSDEYLNSAREPFDPIEHIDLLRQEVLPPDSSIIPIGLSIGGSLALGYTVQRPDSVDGAVILAGGVRGFEHANTPQEDSLFDKAGALIADGDVQGAANLQVRIWGDGPLQEPGRMAEPLAERMLLWNIDISGREFAKRGGSSFDTVVREPASGTQLHTIDMPTAVGYGAYDETYTTAAMKHLGSNIKGATVREFQTAHMINLEVPDEFNEWLSEWLEGNFLE